MKTIRLLLVLTLAATLAACATTSSDRNLYPGAERRADQVATVIVPWQLQIRNANGQKVPLTLIGGSRKESRLRVLPGAQLWTLRYEDPFAADRTGNPYAFDRSGDLSLRFDATAGHAYRLGFETPEQNPALRDAAQQILLHVTDEANSLPISATQSAPEPRRAVETQPSTSPQTEASAAVEGTPMPLEDATLDQLKKWWRVAGDAEREAFLRWTRESR